MAVYNSEFLVCVEDGKVMHGYSPKSRYTEPFRRVESDKLITENPNVKVIVADIPKPEDIELPTDTEEIKEEKLERRIDAFVQKIIDETVKG